MKRQWTGALIALSLAAAAQAEPLGQFTDHRDIGSPKHPGSARHDAASASYSITGGGANMWAERDDFHYVWKRMSDKNVSVTTDLVFTSPSPRPGAPGYVHRKGGIVLRQDLDTGSVYVDALRMGNQQMSLQYRETKGGDTHLIWINTPHQGSVRLVKIGDYATLEVAGPDGKLHRAGGWFKLKITSPYYIGLGVCPHDNDITETMRFSNVRIEPPARPRPDRTLQTMQVVNRWEQTGIVNVPGFTAAPAWSEDGKSFTYGSGGQFYRVSADGMEMTPPAKISVPQAKPARNTASWVYSSAVENGARKLWRARSDGGSRTQVTTNPDTQDWSPHLSPDGKWIVYLSSPAGGSTAALAHGDIEVRLMPVGNGTPDPGKAVTMAKFHGGAESLDFDPWAPDSRNFAFVSHSPHL